MGISIYGFSRHSFATREYLEGPRASLSGADEIQAKLIIATLIYVLSDRPRDAFLMGEDGTGGDLFATDIIDYCVSSCGIGDLWELEDCEHAEDELDWYAAGPSDRAVCVEFLFWLYRRSDFDWYQGPGEHFPVARQLLAALDAFVNRSTIDGVWSIGQTLDIALLFGALVEFFDGWRRPECASIADDLRPYAAAFERFSANGAYAIRA
jgi:hypothetical protein